MADYATPWLDEASKLPGRHLPWLGGNAEIFSEAEARRHQLYQQLTP